jgi:hypothetical protein
MEWNHFLQTVALREGWGIFDNCDHGLRIERWQDHPRFVSDAAAQAHVAHRAIVSQDPLAITALRHLARAHGVDRIEPSDTSTASVATKEHEPTNWNDPASRLRLIENGLAIRLMHSAMFGRLYTVDGGRAHRTLEGARAIAREEAVKLTDGDLS